MPKLRRVFLPLVLIVSFTAMTAAEGAGLGLAINLQGKVTDSSGSPIPGLWVYDKISGVGTQTSASGSYSLQAVFAGCQVIGESAVGEIQVTAGGRGYAYETKKVPLADHNQQTDFQLLYWLYHSVTPNTSGSVPAPLTVNAWTLAPVDSSCLVFTDIRSGKKISLTPTEEFSTWNVRKWVDSTQLSLEADAVPGIYNYEIQATNCQSGVPVTPTAVGVYYFDRSAPQIEILSPKEGMQYVGDQEVGPSYDGLTHVSGIHTFRARVSDDVGLRGASIRVYMQDGAYEYWVNGCSQELLSQTEAEIRCETAFIFDEPNRQYFIEIEVRDMAWRYSQAERLFYLTPV